MFKQYLNRIYLSASTVNYRNLEKLIQITGPHRSILDVGCWDGNWTTRFAKYARADKVYGIEPVAWAAKLATKKGITTYAQPADIGKWPIPNKSINCIVSNQVIEHMDDVDHYLSECYRVLAPGGILITSTNNLSSLHNIFSVIMGWAPFDLTNCSYRFSNLGNPLGLHINQDKCDHPSWLHKRIYTPYWLIKWQAAYGFKFIKTSGAGFYPFPAIFGKFFPKYSAFITTTCQK